jgi:hypothetical protein
VPSLHNFATVRFHSNVSVKTRQWRWCPSTAYAVGLIATDGNLGLRRPIVSFTSSEVELIQLFSGSLQISPRMYRKRGGFGSWTNQVAIWDPELHEWLLSIGLIPRKTLRLGGIAVPDAYLAPLARGLLDGDGSVLSYWHVPNRRKYPGHRNLRLTTRFYSASPVHVEWLAQRLKAVLGIRGSLGVDSRATRDNPLYHLQFAKRASRALLTVLYSDTAAPRLARKHDKWLWFLENESALSSRGYTRR